MTENSFVSKIINSVLCSTLSVDENKSLEIGQPEKILIVRQHNQLGDLLAGVSIFRALKETYPSSYITLIVSPFNYPGMVKNKFIDRIVIFDKKKLINPFYIIKFWRTIRETYDLAIVPVVVSISFTSNLIARLSNSKIRIGPASLDGKENTSKYFFDRRVVLDWREHPDSNVSERSLDIVRPFGINTKDYRSEISFDENDLKIAENFLDKNNHTKDKLLLGLHVGAGKPQNRWSLQKFASLIKELNRKFDVDFYLTGSLADKSELDYLQKHVEFDLWLYVDKPIPAVAGLISLSDLFISNDTGIMHVAGSTGTPLISLFGPTNPLIWAPIGTDKYFIRKSELIDDIQVEDVLNLCVDILKKKGKV